MPVIYGPFENIKRIAKAGQTVGNAMSALWVISGLGWRGIPIPIPFGRVKIPVDPAFGMGKGGTSPSSFQRAMVGEMAATWAKATETAKLNHSGRRTNLSVDQLIKDIEKNNQFITFPATEPIDDPTTSLIRVKEQAARNKLAQTTGAIGALGQLDMGQLLGDAATDMADAATAGYEFLAPMARDTKTGIGRVVDRAGEEFHEWLMDEPNKGK